MNINQKIKEIESKINQLESEDIDFENSISLYQDTVKEAKVILDQLNHHQETLTVLNADTQELIEMSTRHDR
jgi:exonuclease VII small subunit